jgi:hypothetical protein
MESALDFINFWDKQKCCNKYECNFDVYIRFLRTHSVKDDYWAFNDLYNIYLKERNLEYNKEHYEVCKFLAFEYYDDIAAGTYKFNVFESLKNYEYYGA